MSEPETKSPKKAAAVHIKDTSAKPAAVMKPKFGSASTVNESTEGDAIVTQVTIASDADKVEAFERAKKAVHSLDERLTDDKQHAKARREGAEVEGYTAIQEMMRLAECFPAFDGSIDVDALSDFLKRQTGKPSKGVDNKWQPLAKHCSHPNTAAGVVTKRGYILAAVFAERIASDEILEKFDEPEDVGEHKQKKGMRKYILKYQENNKPKLSEEEAMDEFIKKAFGDWDKSDYRKSAEYFLEQLDGWDLLNPDVDYTKILAK